MFVGLSQGGIDDTLAHLENSFAKKTQQDELKVVKGADGPLTGWLPQMLGCAAFLSLFKDFEKENTVM